MVVKWKQHARLAPRARQPPLPEDSTALALALPGPFPAAHFAAPLASRFIGSLLAAAQDASREASRRARNEGEVMLARFSWGQMETECPYGGERALGVVAEQE